jgi:membrane protease YdiL (CAAX protease family)
MNPDGKIYQFFFNHVAQFKWQWRVLVYFFLSLIVANFIAAFLDVILPAVSTSSPGHDLITLIQFAASLTGVWLLTWALLKFMDKRPWRSIGLSFHPEWKREFIFGILMGSLIPFVLFVLLLPWGFISVSVRPVAFFNFIVSLVLNVCIWITAAVWLELVLRGYFMQTMAEGMGKIVATIFVSLMYALIRIQFHTDQLILGLNVAALGFVFAICYFRTRALWTGIGIQFSMNFIQNFFFSTPVQGVRSSYSLFMVEAQSRNIAVGDYFSIEQGLIAFLITVSSVYYLYQSKQLVISETVRKIKFDALSQSFFSTKK